MKKKPEKLRALALFAGHAPSTMRGMMAAYLDALRVKGQTEASVESRAPVLNYFAVWCEERGIQRAAEVTRPILQRYQRWLFYFRKKNGKPLGMRTQYTRISEVTLFFRWLTRNIFIGDLGDSMTPGKGSGSDIGIDLGADYPVETPAGLLPTPGDVILFHELAHAYRINGGNCMDNPGSEEQWVVQNLENLYRAQRSPPIPPRKRW